MREKKANEESMNEFKKGMMSLVKSILKYNPILINENFEVVDGQHRLEAADLYYKAVGILNACSDDCELQDYLENCIKVLAIVKQKIESASSPEKQEI